MADNPIHETAVDAEAALERLATQLGEAGAPPETVKGVTQMADVLREIVKAVGAPDPEVGGEGMEPAIPAPPAEGPVDQVAAEMGAA